MKYCKFIFLFCFAAMLFCYSDLYAKKIGKVNTYYLKVRSKPSLDNSKVLLILEKNEKVDIIRRTKNKYKIGKNTNYWYKIYSRKGKTGWVFGHFLDIKHVAPKKLKFINLNNIRRVTSKKGSIIFETSAGKKSFDLKKNTWKYKIASKAETASQSEPDEETPVKNIVLPDWYPEKNNSLVEDVYLKNGNKWVLTSIDTDDDYSHQHLIDLRGKTVYELPFEDITDFIVSNDSVWAGTPFYIIHIDRNSKKRTDYVTYPAFLSIADLHETKDYVYYITKKYGAFIYDKKTFKAVPIKAVNEIITQRHIVLSSITKKDDKLLMLGNSHFPYIPSKCYLFVYNLTSKSLDIINTNVDYADSFAKIKNGLVFYGTNTDYSEENTQSYTYGGAFLVSNKGKYIKKLTDTPVFEINTSTKPVKFYSKVFMSDTLRSIEFSLIKNTLRVDNESNLCFAEEDNAFSEYNQNDTVSIDREYYISGWDLVEIKGSFVVNNEGYKKQYEDYMAVLSRKERNQEKTVDKIFKKISVNHYTKPQDNGSIFAVKY